MSYPRNAASPPTVAVGVIYLLSDGTIQTSGASARVKTGSGAWGAAAGTLACDTTSGVWTYVPTQSETDAESFLVAVYKASSTGAQVTVVTSASANAGYSGVDWGKVTGASSTVDLSGTTISPAGVRSAVGLASADLDTQLSDLPTVAEFEARTLLAAAYFDPATDTVTVGAMNANTVTASALASDAAEEITADIMGHTITKGAAGSVERAFWQASKAQASAVGEVSGTPTASAFDSDLTNVTGAFDDLLIVFTSGDLTGEARPIDTYSSTNGRITLQEALTSAPAAADEFIIVPSHVHKISDIQSGLATSEALAEAKTEIDKIPRQGSTHKHRQISSDGATKSAVVTIEAST